MNHSSGRPPRPSRLWLTLALSLGAALSPVALAQSGGAPLAAANADTALGRDAAGVLAALAERNPELRAMGFETEAAQARAAAAGSWPDPMVGLELRDVPVRDPTLSPANAGSTRWSVKQGIPLGDRVGLRRGVADAEVAAAGARRSATAAELAMRARSAWTQYWAAARLREQLADVRLLLVDLAQVARARYASGLVPQQDLIKAQTELTMVQAELIAAEADGRQAAARLNAVMARAPDAPLAPPAAPPPVPARALDYPALRRLLDERNPQLAAQGAQLRAAERSVDLSRAARWPELTLGAAAIQRGTRVTDYELMVEVSIPWQRDVIRANENEAHAMRGAAAARRDALAADLAGELGQTWSMLDSNRRQADLLRDTLLPQARLTYASALASYQTGRVDFATVLDAQRQIRRTELDLLKLEADAQVRVAELERLVGEQP